MTENTHQGWRDIASAPREGCFQVRMGDWAGTIRRKRYPDFEDDHDGTVEVDDIMHYNGDVLVSNFYGPYDGWLPLPDPDTGFADSLVVSDDVVERVASAIREHVEPSHPDTIDIIIGVDDAAKAVLAALKPGDKVGDGCVVFDKAMFIRAATQSKADGFSSSAWDCVRLSEEGAEALWDVMLAALDTGESE